MTLEAASDLAVVLALASAPKRVGLGLGMEVHAPHDDGVKKSSIELTIPTAIQSVTNDLSGRSGDLCHAGRRGESSLRPEASMVRPGADDLGRADRAVPGCSRRAGASSPTNQISSFSHSACPVNLCRVTTFQGRVASRAWPPVA